MAAAEPPDFVDQFTALRETAVAANGLVEVAVDGTGDLVGLNLDPRAMRLSSDELAAAIREAFGKARAAAQERAMRAIPEALRQETPELTALLQDVKSDAHARMDDILVVANELTARLDRLMQPRS
ncbi:YbaB/EbfC family nucleoid-associated protein [Nonomuraea antimicrobica]